MQPRRSRAAAGERVRPTRYLPDLAGQCEPLTPEEVRHAPYPVPDDHSRRNGGRIQLDQDMRAYDCLPQGIRFALGQALISYDTRPILSEFERFKAKGHGTEFVVWLVGQIRDRDEGDIRAADFDPRIWGRHVGGSPHLRAHCRMVVYNETNLHKPKPRRRDRRAPRGYGY